MTEPDNLQRQIETAHRHEDRPISEDELLAYHRGEMSDPEAEAFLDRLMVDPEAMSALQDLREMDPRGEAVATRQETAVSWTAFQQRLKDTEPGESAEVDVRAHDKRKHRALPTQWLLAAACAVLAIWGVTREIALREWQERWLAGDMDRLEIDLATIDRGAGFQIDGSKFYKLLEIRLSSADLSLDSYEVILETTDKMLLMQSPVTLEDEYLSVTLTKEVSALEQFVVICLGIHDGEEKELGRFPVNVIGFE